MTTPTGLDTAALRARLVAPAGPYAAVRVVDETGSTNADLVAAARAGAADRTVLLAERQTAGQGRRARRWVSPPGVGLYLSVLLRPAVPAERLAWVTLLAGVAVLRTARRVGVDAVLKWPNDVLAGADRGKCAGVLAEVVPDGEPPAVVVGVGLNVSPSPEQVPPGVGGLPATSLAAAGAHEVDRTALAAALLAELADLDTAWRGAGGDPHRCGLAADYRAGCATVGSRVRVELPDGVLVGTATDIDDDGQLRVRDDDGVERRVSAGDVVHLRSLAEQPPA